MSLLHGAIAHRRVLQCREHTHVPLLRTRIHRSCCYAKVTVDDDEQEHLVAQRAFPIRVPTIPKLGDIESARRLLESAFQTFSFDMPKLPIDSALQGLPFVIPKLSIPMPVFVLYITGFVVTKLKKPQEKNLGDLLVDEGQYPRCAWPRSLKGVHVQEAADAGLLESPHERKVSHEVPIAPHCAWPRATHQLAEGSGVLLSSSVVLYPHSAWPRGSAPANGATLDKTSKELSKSTLTRKDYDVSPGGGPRCAWPRKSISGKQTFNGTGHADNTEKIEAKDWGGGKAPPAECGEAAEFPRRMLATSVGLTVMNHLAKGSVVSSFLDLYSLLPAGSLDIPEEDVAMDVGRRTLLVLIKSSDR